jgi:hypothetical protein
MYKVRTLPVLIGILALFFSIELNAQDTESSKKDSVEVIDKLLMERITIVGNPVWMSNIPGAASYVSSEQLQEQSYSILIEYSEVSVACISRRKMDLDSGPISDYEEQV